MNGVYKAHGSALQNEKSILNKIKRTSCASAINFRKLAHFNFIGLIFASFDQAKEIATQKLIL
jgi:hypothetical protein